MRIDSSRRPDVVGVEQRAHGHRIERRADERARAEQHVAGHLAEVLAEPRVERHPEPDLATIDDALGQVPAGHLLEHPLRLAPVHLHPRRQGERQLDQVVVEERRPQLDRGRHGHAVTPLEQVVGQPPLAVERQHALDGVDAVEAPRSTADGRRCRPAASRRSGAVNGANHDASRSSLGGRGQRPQRDPGPTGPAGGSRRSTAPNADSRSPAGTTSARFVQRAILYLG